MSLVPVTMYFPHFLSGSCWSDEASVGRYSLRGESSKCYEGDVTDVQNPTQCRRNSTLCSGGAVANYVYKITYTPGKYRVE